ncbi:MAG: ABC transporter substrate-binding protein [Flavobacteriales bacterium]|nr:ABC transporter substrate-binding protein [Flavobacteriales bacterium]
MQFIDQMNRSVILEKFPERIVSLVPSQTELLYDLGIVPVGQTIFCVEPAHAFQSAFKIGGTKKLQIDKIRSLKPDLIIANKEENVKEQIEELAADHTVWISDIRNVDDARGMILQIGQITDTYEKALALEAEIGRLQSELIQLKPLRSPKVLYLIWNEPVMAVGSDTFINDVIEAQLGWSNVVAGVERYPELSEEQLNLIDPDLVLLSSEPYPFSEKHLVKFTELFPAATIILVDGTAFSWYGSRMLEGFKYLIELQKSVNG